MRNILDDYLLELILMDSLVFASDRRIPDADRIIQSFIPAGLYDRIMARYAAIADDADDGYLYLPARWQQRAAQKSPAWKRMMITRFLQIISPDGCIGDRDLAEVADLAQSIGAERECCQVFSCLGKPIYPPAPV